MSAELTALAQDGDLLLQVLDQALLLLDRLADIKLDAKELDCAAVASDAAQGVERRTAKQQQRDDGDRRPNRRGAGRDEPGPGGDRGGAHGCPSRHASTISPAFVIHARSSAAMRPSSASNAAIRCGWPIR